MQANGMVERAITRWSEDLACERPDPVRQMAVRMQTWVSEPEQCKSCLARPAVCVRGQMALCSHCREQRLIQTGQALDEHRGIKPTPRAFADRTGLAGHAIVFDSRSVDLGGFYEIISPAAVDRTIAEGTDLRALWNHRSDMTIGRKSAGTMDYWKDQRGLAVHISPPKWAANHVESVERRDVTSMSFGFVALEDDWHLEDGMPVRTVFDMHITEASAVSWPAYTATDLRVIDAAARSEFERYRDMVRARL